jgi:hypothetical protein
MKSDLANNEISGWQAMKWERHQKIEPDKQRNISLASKEMGPG